MRRIYLSLVFLILVVGLFAQYEAPEIQSVRAYFYPDGGCGHVIVSWTFESADSVLSVNVYWDDQMEEAFLITGHKFVYSDFTQNMVHTIGVQAVYNSGESEITTIDIYLSNPFYPNPDEVVFTNNYDGMSSQMVWEAPETVSEDAPQPISYDISLNGVFLANTTDLAWLLTDLEYGENYYVGISVNYSDGSVSAMMRPAARYEMYFHELESAADVSFNQTEGTMSWRNPGQGDIIGGTIMHMGAPILWGFLWPYEGDPIPASFGDDEDSVQLMWGAASWLHNGPIDHERIWMDNLGHCGSTLQAATPATNINQLTDASALSYSTEHIALWDKDTSPDGFGDFAVYHNTSTDHYGVFQHLDCLAPINTPWEVMLQFNATWWYQTNGSDDFSQAPKYFPMYYNIFVDEILVETVCYEMITVSEEDIEVVDLDLYPDTEFDYELLGLTPGETYEVGIEAVYVVGKSPIDTYQFTYHGMGADDEAVSAVTSLYGNYPNPFNPETNIKFSLAKESKVELEVYNLKGQKVKTLVSDVLEAGPHSIVWNGMDERGKSVSSGVYFCKMKSDNYTHVNKMILLK